MFEENILNPNELTKSELGDIATEQGYKVYGNETLDAAKKFISDMIEKSEKEMLSEEEQLAFESVVDEIKLLKAVKVRNEDLTVGNMYVAKEEDLEKARQAKYFKREPKAGGGYKYYYTEAQYKKEKGGEEKKEDKKGDIAAKYHLPKETSPTKLDELDADLSRAGIEAKPDFNNMTIDVDATLGQVDKANEILKKYSVKTDVEKKKEDTAKEKYGASKDLPGSNQDGIDDAIKRIKKLFSGSNLNVNESSGMAKAFAKNYNIEPSRAASLLNKYSKK